MKAHVFGLIFCLVMGATGIDEVTGQTHSTVSVIVNRYADLGPSSYRVRLSGLTTDPFSPRSEASATAPDGTRFDIFSIVQSLSLDQIVARFAGEWTINDSRPELDERPVQRHHFSVTADDLTVFPTSIPAITSPPNGALLPVKFDFTSTGNGIQITAPGLSYTGSGPNRVDFTNQSRFLPKVVQARTSIGTGNSQGEAVPVDSSPARSFSFAVHTYNWSPPMTWTVGVPEPSTLGLASFALLSLTALRRCKSPRRQCPSHDADCRQQTAVVHAE